MAATEHRFLAGLRWSTDVEYQVAGIRPRWDRLHLAQSQLGAECGVMATLMAAMVLRGISRRSVERIARSKRGPLRELWTRSSPNIFAEGTDHEDLAHYCEAFEDLTCSTLLTSSASRIGKAARQAIEQGHAPILHMDARTWSHMSLVVGAELMAGGPVPSALLMLDSAHSPPWISPFNARLDLDSATARSVRARRPYTLPLRYADGEAYAVKLRSLTVIRPRPP